jgi:nucleoside-diphosphate-sugar epimerase
MQISVLGCGWLGGPLARALVRDGHQVLGSSRSADRRQYLAGVGVVPYPIDLDPMLRGTGLDAFFASELLIVTLPPGRGREEVVEFYQTAIQNILVAARANGVQRLLFTSSTGVYGATTGLVDENTPTAPQHASGQAVLAAEQRLRESSNPAVTILRLAGLAGPDRQPGRWLAGKHELARGDAPVNLVHQVDVIAAIRAVIEKAAWNKIYNVCAAEHPTRAAFYRHAATRLGLEPPTFLPGGETDKRIDSRRIRRELGLTFRYDDPFGFPA